MIQTRTDHVGKRPHLKLGKICVDISNLLNHEGLVNVNDCFPR